MENIFYFAAYAAIATMLYFLWKFRTAYTSDKASKALREIAIKAVVFLAPTLIFVTINFIANKTIIPSKTIYWVQSGFTYFMIPLLMFRMFEKHGRMDSVLKRKLTGEKSTWRTIICLAPLFFAFTGIIGMLAIDVMHLVMGRILFLLACGVSAFIFYQFCKMVK